jgi:hypothetical protein
MTFHASEALRQSESGVFALLGIGLGAWLTRRSELMRIRIERRTMVFDEACALTAQYYLLRSSVPPTPPDENFMISVMCLDRKIATHFSGATYAAWRGVEVMIAYAPKNTDTATKFSEARKSALDALGKELR